jgi:hypothetical protein
LSALVTSHAVAAQSASVAHVVSSSLLQTPFVQVPVVATTHVTAFFLPHEERAAHGTRFFTQRRFTPAARAASRTAWDTQRTYWPWFFQGTMPVPSSTPSHGHVASTNAPIVLAASSSHAPWP